MSISTEISKRLLKAAKETALDMSADARLSRAREMGFYDPVLYHGTSTHKAEGEIFKGFELFEGQDMSRSVSRSPVGKLGVSIAEQPNVADDFAKMASPEGGEGSAILPLKFRSDKMASVELSGDETNNEIYGTVVDLWKDGFDSIRFMNYSTPNGEKGSFFLVKDPAQLRSINAKFDPKNKNSKDLLAGIGGTGLGAGLFMAQPNEAQAGELTIEQQKAIAMAKARKRKAEFEASRAQPETPQPAIAETPAEPAPAPQSKLEFAKGLFDQLGQGATFNFSDEIGAALAAAYATGADGANFGEAYNDIVNSVRQQNDAFAEANPKASLAANIVGGVTSGGLGVAKAIKTLAPAAASTAAKVGVGSATGAVEGGISGAGDADGEDMASSVLTGAAVGGVLGGAMGGVGARFAKRSQLKDEIADLFQKDPQNIKLARYMKEGAEKVTKDRVATEAIKQGYDEATVAAIKGASPVDRKKMMAMVDLLEKGKQNARFAAVNRPSDVVGDSIVQRVRFIERANREAGEMIETAANGLKGKPVDFSPAVNEFLGELDSLGVKFDPASNTVNFKGSDFEGITGAENAIKRLLTRMSGTGTPDAYDVHRLKRYIDENVEYGKSAEGLTGKAERAFKKLRRNMDAALDSQYKAYDIANTKYAQTKTALDDIQQAAGSTIDFSSDNLDKSLGVLSRRLLSNVQSRGRLLDSIQVLEDVAAANGAKFNDDIVTQALFADELDSVFGAAAKTSLAGDTQKSIKTGAKLMTGEKGALLDFVAEKAQKLRGINEENAIKVMKSLLARE